MTTPEPDAPQMTAARLWRAAWPHVRAALVVLHLFAITFQSLPSVGGGLSRQAWKSDTVQGEFRAWSSRLQGWGFDISLIELEDQLWDFAVGYEKARRSIIDPLMPYYDYCGTYQTWRMFVAPHRFPGRLQIEVDRGDGWELAYEARSNEHTWHRRWFDHDRFRAATFRYAWKHYRRPRNQFADWVAERFAEEEPDARRVRVSFMRYRTLSPEEVRSGKPIRAKRELVVIRKVRPRSLVNRP